ncbi:hypothetical protein MLDJOKPK_00079 [Salmonella phage SPAsTU]|nr:hypothetical protein STsAS_062 [Salmonella phage STsAS]AWN09021.1 hypothetical protein MLDJOKPK_00079 [Salmonella phage SPAsTU]
MVKLIVINMDYDRSVRFRFELPETNATETFLSAFREAKTSITFGRRWQIFYNARKTLMQAVEAAKLPEVKAKLEPFLKDPLAIGIMLDELVNKPKPQADED